MSQTAVTLNAESNESQPLPAHLLHRDGLRHESMPLRQAQTSSKGPRSKQTANGEVENVRSLERVKISLCKRLKWQSWKLTIPYVWS